MARAWRIPAVAAAAVVTLLTLPPVLLAGMLTPSGSTFSGYLVIARDAFVYQSMWRQGWHGAWLFRSQYTSENLTGIILYPWYLWPGHVLGWIPGPWLYQVERLAAGAVLLLAVWLLTCELFRASLMRRWAMLLAALGGGIGVLLPGTLQLGPLSLQATEMRSPGSSVADLVAMAPHLPWAMALMCWSMVVALRLRCRLSAIELISGLAALLGLQLIYPQLSLLAVAVIGGWALLNRQPRALRFALLGGLLQVPYLGYLFFVWRSSPSALAVIRPALEVGSPVDFLFLSHLVASALIVIAIWRGRLRGNLWLPALWIVGMTACMFLPGLSRVLQRTFMASSVPFGLCAAPGLLSLLRGIKAPAWRRRLALLALSASSLYGLFSLAQPFWIAAFRLDASAEYESAAEASLLQQVAPDLSSGDVVLTTYLQGVFVPAQTDARVFAGHPDMTIDAPRKAAEANAFFSTWNQEQRQAFLLANHIDYVLASSGPALIRLSHDPNLRLVKRVGDTALFAVVP